MGGDRLTAGLRARAKAHGLRLVHYYGAAEASFVAVDPDGTGLRLLPGVEAETEDGLLLVRSDQLAEPDGSSLHLTGPDGAATALPADRLATVLGALGHPARIEIVQVSAPTRSPSA